MKRTMMISAISTNLWHSKKPQLTHPNLLQSRTLLPLHKKMMNKKMTISAISVSLTKTPQLNQP